MKEIKERIKKKADELTAQGITLKTIEPLGALVDMLKDISEIERNEEMRVNTLDMRG